MYAKIENILVTCLFVCLFVEHIHATCVIDIKCPLISLRRYIRTGYAQGDRQLVNITSQNSTKSLQQNHLKLNLSYTRNRLAELCLNHSVMEDIKEFCYWKANKQLYLSVNFSFCLPMIPKIISTIITFIF